MVPVPPGGKQRPGRNPGGQPPASFAGSQRGAGPPQQGCKQYWSTLHVALPHGKGASASGVSPESASDLEPASPPSGVAPPSPPSTWPVVVPDPQLVAMRSPIVVMDPSA